MRIKVHPRFEKDLDGYPHNVRDRASRALQRFMENPHRPGLNFEKMVNWENHYSIRVSRDYRIVLRRETDAHGELFVALRFGTHDVYRRGR